MSTTQPQINYRIHGPENGDAPLPPIVFLHGLMGFAANWGKIWPHFAPKRNCLVLDQRGHGKSEKPSHGYAPLDYAQDLRRILQELGWEKFHLVGHSMGGRVAMIFAAQFPELLLSLTLEDSGAEALPERQSWLANLLGGIPAPFANRQAAQDFFQQKFATDPLLGGFLFTNLIEDSANGSYTWRFFEPGMHETIAQGRARNAMDIFSKLTIATLLVRGGKSTEFPAEEAERMRASRANIELVTIPQAGHFVHAQCPKEFTNALEKFIALHDGEAN